MNLTPEQQAIIQATGNIKINAVAGSGKTTTIIEYAKARPANSRILYLAFNKSVKLEAISKFQEKGLNNVKVETAHSLAFRHIVPRNQYNIRPHGYKTHEIAELLGLKGNGEKHAEYIIASHIKQFLAYYCNSNKNRVQELNYLDVITDPEAKNFARNFYKYIETKTRLLLTKMNNGDIDITHDFYLKKFQLANPSLPFDYILFDEGQDASPAMLDIFLKQHATKVIVGDTHQQIYSWRYAVNSLEKTDFQIYNLSHSFRFPQPIADLSVKTLEWKHLLTENHAPVEIKGQGDTTQMQSKAVLARSNLGLLLKAIEYVIEKKRVKNIYFEGNINSYTYAEDGTSLYDVLNLYNGKRKLIKDKIIKEMRGMEELNDYIEKTEDVQLGMMVEIVEEYGNRVPEILKDIKNKHVENDEKEKAEIIFSTVHRCKGMEYDAIHLVNDFINEEKVDKLAAETKNNPMKFARVNEEINLLYVAITRARNVLFIPETLMPDEFPQSAHIKIMKEEEADKPDRNKKSYTSPSSSSTTKDKAYTYEKAREAHTKAFQPWTQEMDEALKAKIEEGISLNEIAEHFGRTKGAIKARLKKIESSGIID